MRAWLALAGLTLSGCYMSSASDAEAGVPDAGASCEMVGDLVQCTEECGGYRTCLPLRPSDTYSCLADLCLQEWEFPEAMSDQFNLRCGLPDDSRPFRYWSPRGDHACVRSGDLAAGIGVTIPESDCAPVAEARGLDCYWSDGSIRTRTPPAVHTICPEAPAPASILCGGGCGNCYSVVAGDREGFDVPCIGRNDDRDLGVCAIVREGTIGCSPGQPASTLCLSADQMSEEWATTTCSCLSFRRADGFERAGWVVPTSNCATYRSLYPGEVECYDDAWNPIP